MSIWPPGIPFPPKRPPVLKYYLSRIVRNLCFKRLDYLAAEKRQSNGALLLSELEECIPDEAGDVERTLEIRTLGRSLNGFLSTLNADDRRVFLSRYYEAMTAPQIAAKYGGSARQVKYRLEKLRKELRRTLEKEGICP